METYKRICIKDFTLEDSEGSVLDLKRGQEYLTSREEKGKVIVFTNYWVRVPVDIFAGEKIFTKE